MKPFMCLNYLVMLRYFYFFQYNNTLIKKIFQVNLTSVTLKQGVMVPNSPRINPNSRSMEVVIAQPNQTVGELKFDASQTVMLNEAVGMLNITVQRTGSLSGTVGFRFIARPLISNIYSSANNSDFSPSEGTVMLAPGISSTVFNITIINDDVPEIGEGFYVQISRPIGGVRIGSPSKVDVVIKPNDEPYGRFGYVCGLKIDCREVMNVKSVPNVFENPLLYKKKFYYVFLLTKKPLLIATASFKCRKNSHSYYT